MYGYYIRKKCHLNLPPSFFPELFVLANMIGGWLISFVALRVFVASLYLWLPHVPRFKIKFCGVIG